jgi:hypothetical protein
MLCIRQQAAPTTSAGSLDLLFELSWRLGQWGSEPAADPVAAVASSPHRGGLGMALGGGALCSSGGGGGSVSSSAASAPSGLWSFNQCVHAALQSLAGGERSGFDAAMAAAARCVRDPSLFRCLLIIMNLLINTQIPTNKLQLTKLHRISCFMQRWQRQRGAWGDGISTLHPKPVTSH